MPSLYFGIPVLCYRATKFDPAEAFHLMALHNVRNTFIPPTALKMMRQVPEPNRHWDFALRTLGSGGESLGRDASAEDVKEHWQGICQVEGLPADFEGGPSGFFRKAMTPS